jgi:hypothetical protein
MKAWLPVLALAVGGLLPAQDPRPAKPAAGVKAAPAEKGAATGWQYSRWGMTADQIAAASGGAARPLAKGEVKGKFFPATVVIAVSEFRTGPFAFDVYFRARKGEAALKLVQLHLKDEDQYEDLRTALISTYGPWTFTQTKGDRTVTQWMTASEVVELVQMYGYVFLEYQERPRKLVL